MTTYNWDLIERLLHEVQNGEPSFTPRPYAEQYAAEKASEGEQTENVDHLKAVAGEYESLLVERGY
ncbi:MAG: transcriptional regulator, partial [Pseudomonadota bacterium]|nr:transcriptional regulator [Pseudomonadota bacterium]